MQRAHARVVVVQLLPIWVVTASARQARPNKTARTRQREQHSRSYDRNGCFIGKALSAPVQSASRQLDARNRYPIVQAAVWFGSSRAMVVAIDHSPTEAAVCQDGLLQHALPAPAGSMPGRRTSTGLHAIRAQE